MTQNFLKIKTSSLLLIILLSTTLQLQAEGAHSYSTFKRTILKSMNETGKKVFTVKFPGADKLIALNARIAKALIDEKFPAGDQPFVARATEGLLPVIAAQATTTALAEPQSTERKNVLKNSTKDILKKIVSSRFFARKETREYEAFNIVARASTFFKSDMYIDPTNLRKHFNWIGGVALIIEEQAEHYVLTPLLCEKLGISQPQAKALAAWIAEDLAHDYITKAIEKISHSITLKTSNVHK